MGRGHTSSSSTEQGPPPEVWESYDEEDWKLDEDQRALIKKIERVWTARGYKLNAITRPDKNQEAVRAMDGSQVAQSHTHRADLAKARIPFDEQTKRQFDNEDEDDDVATQEWEAIESEHREAAQDETEFLGKTHPSKNGMSAESGHAWRQKTPSITSLQKYRQDNRNPERFLEKFNRQCDLTEQDWATKHPSQAFTVLAGHCEEEEVRNQFEDAVKAEKNVPLTWMRLKEIFTGLANKRNPYTERVERLAKARQRTDQSVLSFVNDLDGLYQSVGLQGPWRLKEKDEDNKQKAQKVHERASFLLRLHLDVQEVYRTRQTNLEQDFEEGKIDAWDAFFSKLTSAETAANQSKRRNRQGDKDEREKKKRKKQHEGKKPKNQTECKYGDNCRNGKEKCEWLHSD
jgi:predicted secreted protein